MTTVEIAARVDARGQSCPMPIVRTAQAVKALAPGPARRGPRHRPGVRRDFVAWCRSTGHELVEQTTEGAVHRFVIRRK